VEIVDAEAGLAWLDGGLPCLTSVSHHHFDLANEFDISRYLDILADEATAEANSSLQGSKAPSAGRLSKEVSQTSCDASTVVPAAGDWDKW